MTIPTEPIGSIPRPLRLIEAVAATDGTDPALDPLYEEAIRDTEGRVVGASKVARDVTAQKRTEAENRRLLAEVEAERRRLADLFQVSPSFLCVLRGPDHVFERANDRYHELVGRRDLIGKSVREALPEVAGQGYFEVLDRVYRTGEAFATTGARVRVFRGGPLEERVLDFVYQPLRDGAGAVTGGPGPRGRPDRPDAGGGGGGPGDGRVRAAQAPVRDGPVEHPRPRLRVRSGSPVRLRQRGPARHVGQDLGRGDREDVPGARVRAVACHDARPGDRADQGDEKANPGEVPFTGANGRRVYDYILVPVFGAGGEVEAVAGTTRDVTDRKRHEDQLAEADRRKDEFLALLAHELRNPLAPIRNGLQVLRLAERDPAARGRAREMMDRQLGHLVRMVDDLLDVSRITRGKMELRPSRVRLADVVGSAVETARPVIDAAGHELTVDLPPDPVALDADLTRLAQVFANLLTNSAKYTPPGGKIRLAAAARGGEAVVTVRDAGIGIPADALPTIFDMFSQVDRSIEKATGGLGIGLALVKGLVEMHGGTVTAASDGPGRGSEFTVTLPIPGGTPEPPAAAPAGGRRGPGRRVLVVDDNRDGA
ncbi:MAG: hybrid sensor histidine kinase/response regulator, partial [Gemmataceae bacterium]|nr:hybrid sensor histidine kinase/response regulator [Gemmataceae bacterium]